MTVQECSARPLARQRVRAKGAIARMARPAARARVGAVRRVLEGRRDLATARVATLARVAIVTLRARILMLLRSRAWVMQLFVPKEMPWKAPRWH